MDSVIFRNEDVVQCMNCGAEQDHTAEVYILRRILVEQFSEAAETCRDCKKTFSASRINEDEVKVMFKR